MKRAESQVIGPPFFQLYKAADDLRNVDAAEDLLYGVWWNQVYGLSAEFNLKISVSCQNGFIKVKNASA